MGCDIHCYIEHRRTGTRHDGNLWSWESFARRINPGRNYRIFGRLAGVRWDCPQVAPVRDAPDDMGWYADADFWMQIRYDGSADDENSCTPQDAERWGFSRTRGEFKPYTMVTQIAGEAPTTTVIGAEHAGKPTHIASPDWHTASWVTPDEWAQAIDDPTDADEIEYRAILAALRAFEADGHEARVVFWFDN